MTDAIQAARNWVVRARCVVDCQLPGPSETEADHAEGCEFHRTLDHLIAVVERETWAAMPCYVNADEHGMPMCRGQYAANDFGAERLKRCPPCQARSEKEQTT